MKKTVNVFLLFAFAILIMSGTIDLNNLYNYANQPIPSYITRDNTGGNSITNEGATLGRVLFYDKKLSSNDSISCSSCHKQEFAFGDTSFVSQGVNGVTKRHAVRLVNSRFSEEFAFFWDERANSLEQLTTMPIKDHIEMGFSGTNGDPSMSDLLIKLNAIPYYNDLFNLVFGDTLVTEPKIKIALAQFIRSIQSFDSKFDIGLAAAGGNINAPFPNYTAQENAGKNLFSQITIRNFQTSSPDRIGGGFTCISCHRPPEFDIDPVSGNNGVITVANDSLAIDLEVTRSPSLRDLFSPAGILNGPLMHDGSFKTFDELLTHYDHIQSDIQVNPDLDSRLTVALSAGSPSNIGLNMLMTPQERTEITAFMKTLTGVNIYTDPKWSDPFDANGNITILSTPLGIKISPLEQIGFNAYPNPAIRKVTIEGQLENKFIMLRHLNGQFISQWKGQNSKMNLDIGDLSNGIYLIQINNEEGKLIGTQKIIKQ